MANLEKPDANRDSLQSENERLKKINKALMGRVERSIASQGGAFSLFEGNILLSTKVKNRTSELENLNTQIVNEKENLGLIIRALPGKLILFSDNLKIEKIYSGLGVEVPIRNAVDIKLCFGIEFQASFFHAFEKLKNIRNPVQFTFTETIASATRHFEGTVSLIRDGSYVLYLIDSTEETEKKAIIKAQESQIIQASKLSSLGEMAGGIAHEINNPLAVISGIAFRLRSLQSRGMLTPESLEENTRKIETTVERVSKIVKSLRQISRDASQDQFESVDLLDVINDVLDVCREKFVSKGIRLDVEIEKGTQILCKRIPLGQVLLNLMNNSYYVVKDQDDGWIRLEMRMVGELVRVYVIDSGLGISREILKKIFQPFFTTKEVGEGTGLGMSISKTIITDHGGTLEYELVGGNTSFYFEIKKGVN